MQVIQIVSQAITSQQHSLQCYNSSLQPRMHIGCKNPPAAIQLADVMNIHDTVNIHDSVNIHDVYGSDLTDADLMTMPTSCRWLWLT